jgi:hypothetical protein
MQNSALYSLAYTLVAVSPHIKLVNDKLIPNICIHIEEAKVTSIHGGNHPEHIKNRTDLHSLYNLLSKA